MKMKRKNKKEKPKSRKDKKPMTPGYRLSLFLLLGLHRCWRLILLLENRGWRCDWNF
jgi:hypothetical protein